MPEVKLYQFGPVPGRESASPFCVKIHYALRYKRVPFEVVNLATPFEVRRLNPRGKLPVLSYDGTTVADSTDIIRLVEERHPEPRLYPRDQRARATAMLLEDWADEALYWHAVYENWLVADQFEAFAAHVFAAIPGPFRPVVKLLARRGISAQLRAQGLGRLKLDEHRARLGAELDWLDALVDGAFLCGNDLSVADISVACELTSLMSPFMKYTASQVGDRRKLAAWYDRVKSAVA
jgi:glutathione S-transferase